MSIFLLVVWLKTHEKSAEGQEEKVRKFLPYWATELLKMWEEAERKYKDRGPSSPRGS